MTALDVLMIGAGGFAAGAANSVAGGGTFFSFPALLAVAVKSAGLEGLLDHVISVDGIRKYKTHPDAYALGLQATGLEARQIAFVSCNSWDALAATWFGYQTLWVNRYQLPFEELGVPPVYTGSTLRDVLSLPGLGAPA